MWPIGVESLENFLAHLGPHAGSVIVDEISTSWRERRQVTRTAPPGGENERAFSIRLSMIWPRRDSWPGTWKPRPEPPSNRKVTLTQSSRFTSFAPRPACSIAGEVDRRRLLALQLGIEPARVGNIRDQTVEPLDVVLNDAEQASAAFVGLGERQVSTAERNEVSGFFSSCATSAAKLSMASIRL